MADRDYSLSSRVLHSLALDRRVAELWFDIERATHGRNLEPPVDRHHVFVCGLARAGTTILMRLLHATGEFRSLTYRDMPFILAPNFWRRVSAGSRKAGVEKERAHGDGLAHSFDSPEALEEVFWRVFAGEEYIREASLVPMTADEELIGQFRAWVGLTLKGFGGQRYLSKNNNNLLRLESICRAFPAASVLIPFREPLQHARSLLVQHRNFLEQHERDSFSRRYMRWLAHHEFGSDHRPFVFSDADQSGGSPENIEYWLQLWIHVHGYLLENFPEQAIAVSYERLCNEPGAVWPRLCERLEIARPGPVEMLRSPNVTEVEADDTMALRAREIYSGLQELAE